MTIERHVEAIVGRLLDVMHMASRIPHHLLGNATDIHTGTTQRAVLDNGNPGAMLGCSPGMRDAAAATTDDN
jgi:hypothetical protein